MRFYFNLNPSRAIIREAMTDPRGIAFAIATGWLLLQLNGAVFESHQQALKIVLYTAATLVFTVMTANEVGLATIRHEAIIQGYQRPLPPRHGAAFDRMLAGSGIYILIYALGAIVYTFSPLSGLGMTAFATLPFWFGAFLYGYAVSYSNERYTAWYGEIWPDEDGGEGWDESVIPDPAPENRLSR